MRIRRLTLADGRTSLAVRRSADDPWVALVQELGPGPAGPRESLMPVADDLVGFLALGEQGRDAAGALIDAVPGGSTGIDESPMIPFQPGTLRAFSVYEQHQIQSAHGLAKRYLPKASKLAKRYEKITGKTFPKFRPVEMFYRHPLFYMGNPLSFLPDGATIPWPSYSKDLDFEIELAAIVCKPVRPDAQAAEAEQAIGGYVLVNDVSARDTQWDEYRNGIFGPVIKSKTFANQLGTEVVTADEVAPRVDSLNGEVVVNGEVWSRPSTAGAHWGYGDMAAYCAAGEGLRAGELLSAGTLPNGCGLELDRWIQPGDQLELKLDLIGSLGGTVGEPGAIPVADAR